MSLSRILFALSAPALVLVAQAPGDLTLEKAYHPTQRVTFGQPAARYTWQPDGSLLETRTEGAKSVLTRIEPASGKRQAQTGEAPVGPAARFIPALVAAGLTDAEARNLLPSIAPDARGAVLLQSKEQLLVLDIPALKAQKVGKAKDFDEALLSPDGKRLAYLQGNDIQLLDLATGAKRALTTGGSPTRLNGRLDWVTQEEVYGRGKWRAFWWSPDSSRLAFLSLDVAKAPQFRMTDDRYHPQRTEDLAYPKAGEPNPVTTLGVVDLQGQVSWLPSPAPDKETLIVQVGFDPKGRVLAAWQDRIQTWMELRRYEGTASTLMIREHNPKGWVDRPELPRYLADGTFLWVSDKTGTQHLYLHDAEGRELRPLTSGDWMMRRVLTVDEKAGRILFEANKDNAIGADAYAVDLKGGEPRRLTQGQGTHRVSLDATNTWLVDSWSSHATPGQTVLRPVTKGTTTLLEDREKQPRPFRMGTVKQVQVPNRDGYLMDAQLLLPPDFNPARKYPVFQTGYAGPASPTVKDAWNANLFEHLLAQQGWIVWKCEPRSSSNKGMKHAQIIYKNLGHHELKDYEDGLAWLGKQGYADLSRVVLDGWSYGGFMASYAAANSRAYKGVVVGAPVTDFRLYDSIYTERFMALPKDNAAGYDATNVMKKAPQIEAKVLLLHGLMDENVHPQNSVMLIEALTLAGKDFRFVPLPGTGHSPREPWHNWVRFKNVWDFLQTM